MSKDTIRIDLEKLSSEALLDIWNTDDPSKYKKETFPIVREILVERGIDVPPRFLVNSIIKGKQARVLNENKPKNVAAYFSFETLISASLIRIMYFIGMLSITYSSYNITTNSVDYRSATGAALLVFGNLFWRIVCEGLIIFFRIHESLDSINRKL